MPCIKSCAHKPDRAFYGPAQLNDVFPSKPAADATEDKK